MKICSPETEEGNIEYKRFFKDITLSKLNHLTAQMNWRINEGNGTCHYYLGICDDGTLYTNFTQEQIDYTLDILNEMIHRCNSYIETININRIKYNHESNLIWLDVVIRKKQEYTNEYRILILDNNVDLSNIIPEYKKSKSIYFNTIIYNYEKYLFFECDKIHYNDLINKIDFNLILNNKMDCDLDKLIEYVNNNMIGNNEYNDKVQFNIIKYHYNSSIGHIVYGFLKSGTIRSGMMLNNNINNNINIISIHNNMIDCFEAIAPATVSLRISINNVTSIDGFLF